MCEQTRHECFFVRRKEQDARSGRREEEVAPASARLTGLPVEVWAGKLAWHAATFELHGRKIEIFAIFLEFPAGMALSNQAPEPARRLAPFID